MDRAHTIAEYVNEVKLLPRETQLDGLLKRWPEITAEEFKSAVRTYNVRELDEQEKALLELVIKKETLEAQAFDSKLSADEIAKLGQGSIP